MTNEVKLVTPKVVLGGTQHIVKENQTRAEKWARPSNDGKRNNALRFEVKMILDEGNIEHKEFLDHIKHLEDQQKKLGDSFIPFLKHHSTPRKDEKGKVMKDAEGKTLFEPVPSQYLVLFWSRDRIVVKDTEGNLLEGQDANVVKGTEVKAVVTLNPFSFEENGIKKSGISGNIFELEVISRPETVKVFGK